MMHRGHSQLRTVTKHVEGSVCREARNGARLGLVSVCRISGPLMLSEGAQSTATQLTPQTHPTHLESAPTTPTTTHMQGTRQCNMLTFPFPFFAFGQDGVLVKFSGNGHGDPSSNVQEVIATISTVCFQKRIIGKTQRLPNKFQRR